MKLLLENWHQALCVIYAETAFVRKSSNFLKGNSVSLYLFIAMLFLEVFWQDKCFGLIILFKALCACNSSEHVCHEINYILLHFGKMMTTDVFFFPPSFQCALIPFNISFLWRTGIWLNTGWDELGQRGYILESNPLRCFRSFWCIPDSLKIWLSSFLRLVKICSGADGELFRNTWTACWQCFPHNPPYSPVL